MTKKPRDPKSSSNSGSGPVDPNLTTSTPAAPAVPLPSLKDHLAPFVSDAPKNGNGNGNGHHHHDDKVVSLRAAASNDPAAPAVKKSRPEPALERLDPKPQEIDDFSPENLKSAEEMGDEDMGLSGAMSLVKVQRPQAKVFIRCHPDPATHIQVRLIKNDVDGVGDGKFYFVPARMADHPALVDHWRWFTLFPCITRQGVFFLWAVGNRDEDGKYTEASLSARRALALARTKWTRVWWTRGGNNWKELDKDRAVNVPDPIWPYPDPANGKTTGRTPQEIVQAALNDFTIDENDHVLIKVLDGRE
jgi:hypothetical protein